MCRVTRVYNFIRATILDEKAMGIPHLITYLRPYATSQNLAGQTVVIDGPGFAYHIWHVCLSAEPKFRNPFEATPSYKLLGETAIQWLDELQAHKISLKKIVFDGFLPPSKSPIRTSRLMGYTKQLIDYNKSWPQSIPSMYTIKDSHKLPIKLFNTQSIPSSFTKLPAAPFLVPAIIESLSHCERYANCIEVVHGEADSYCAHYVRSTGGIVVTGDSDLLVHDIGNGAVAFFRDLELDDSNNSSSLRCRVYEVAAIVERLSLPKGHGLQSLAFEMTMNVHGSFRELLQKAVKEDAISSHERHFEEFSSEYKQLQLNLEEKMLLQDIDDMQLSNRQLHTLDPRVSEFVLQFKVFARATGSPEYATPSSTIKNVFLPFLLDCPLRTSAWEICTSVRQLAYGLVNLVLPEEEQISIIAEHRRVQNGNRAREWQVPAAQDVPMACVNLHSLLVQIRQALPDQSDLWKAIALYQDLELVSTTDKSNPNPSFMEQAMNGKAPQFRLTWDGIHASAQFEASYYSFRILKQILDAVLAVLDYKSIPAAVLGLRADLESLPALAELSPTIDRIRNSGSIEDQKMAKVVRQMLNLEQQPAQPVDTPQKKAEKKRKANTISKEVKGPKKRWNNIFEVLETT